MRLIGALLLAAACGAEEPARDRPQGGAPATAGRPRAPAAGVAAGGAAVPPAPLSPAERVAAQAQVAAFVDSVDRRLRTVSGLSGAERRQLRHDVNERQLQRARLLGVRPGTTVAQAVGAGRLVALADTTPLWTVRELDFSEPFLTPAAEAMLFEVARRFQHRLDSLGVPHIRLDITSVLRTPEKQAELRRRNANASRVESAHEFGTTLDIAYRRYAPPGQYPAALGSHPEVRLLADSMMIELARLRGAELQAVLGRVLLELQHEGKLLVMMERRQTVYHITVGRRLPPVRGQG